MAIGRCALRAMIGAMLAAGMLAADAMAAAAAPSFVESHTRLGDVRLFQPAGTPRELVFLFSDQPGWNAALDGVAAAMAGEGVAVVGVNLPRYLDALAASDDRDCHYLDSDIERLSKEIEQRLGLPTYRWPILAGLGAGGTLAYGAAAQAPDATIAGALVADPSPSLATRAPLCAGAKARPAPGGFAYDANPDMPAWLRVLDRQTPSAMPWIAQIPQARRLDPPAEPDLTATFLALLQPMIGYAMPTGEGLADLPLIELPAHRTPRALAVILSGDGGWRDIDSQLGETLAAGDIAVVGLDTLRYFWSAKPPAQVATDLQRILRHYQAAWGLKDVLLIGYSFGADVLPGALAHVRAEAQRDIVQISLLGLSHDVAFEFHVGGWLGLTSSDAVPIAPDAKQLDMAKVQCVYGEEEDDSLCPDPLFAQAELIRTTGGHHFDGDYQALAKRILDGYGRRRASRS